MFGSYLVNEKKESPVRLSLTFSNGELNLYACVVTIIEGNINDTYDWSGDVMNDSWDPKKARKKLKFFPAMKVCDALLSQEIFAGVGNIIKNEVLYRIRVHPESRISQLPAPKINQLIKQVREYSFDFLEWKKQFVLKDHWLAYSRKLCTRCNIELVKKVTGVKKRSSYYCDNCQELYD